MNIVIKPIDEIREYENNPRFNDDAVQFVAKSIQDFGFKVPVIIDVNNVIVAGHTRVKAARQLGMTSVPCIVVDDLTDEQIRAFRLADNKVSEVSEWDFEKLELEMDDLDFDWDELGFCFSDDEELFDDAPEPLSSVYQEPEIAKIKCPKCGHVDSKVRFMKV